MLKIYSSEEGSPTCLYRMPSEIRLEMERVNKRINELSAATNIRNMLTEILACSAANSADECISELEDVINEAKEGLSELGRLKSVLEILSDELDETRSVMGL